ncbi:DUF4221 family protein [Algoriphagus antarcticus]|uniref:Uncharacterized protein DUF4221 n=1 Tax=Algoriphagus antarcticus TaxID=238540 RepID=A0A3E0DS02_9BACT|nr:DUF4221 family protein [Algoriphagus antarcticus]REG86302.1 uncharacterized protein DUF4221 [Algoriphagus antarcticus]
MKKLLAISLLALIASCDGKDSESTETKNILENLTYSVDTVIVDAGDDFFVIPYGLGRTGFTQDKGRLVFFENDPLKLTQVDLNELKLISKTEFQKEGPNGIGPYISDFQIGPNDELAIQSYVSYAKFNIAGEITENLKVVPEGIDSELANDYQKLYQRAVYDFQKNQIYTQPYREGNAEKELFIIVPQSKKVTSLPIPEMKSVSDFSRTYLTKSGENTMINFFGVSDFIEKENGFVLISAAPMSGFYRLDPAKDSVEFIDIQHQTVPNEWNITVMKEYNDEATFQEDSRKVYKQLNYMAIKWDETREMYLRLGLKTYFGESREDPSTFEVYLFAYDEDFNVLGETKIEGIEAVPSGYFWKDGKLWSSVNVADELGFAVFTFDF